MHNGPGFVSIRHIGQLKEGMFRAIGMAGIEPTPPFSRREQGHAALAS
jgi:hypothetical protein